MTVTCLESLEYYTVLDFPDKPPPASILSTYIKAVNVLMTIEQALHWVNAYLSYLKLDEMDTRAYFSASIYARLDSSVGRAGGC